MHVECLKTHVKGTKRLKRKAGEGDNLEKQNAAKCRMLLPRFNKKDIREQGKHMLFHAKFHQNFLEQ